VRVCVRVCIQAGRQALHKSAAAACACLLGMKYSPERQQVYCLKAYESLTDLPQA